MGEPFGSPKGGEEVFLIIHCSLFINQYGPYWSVIWPILLSNEMLVSGCQAWLFTEKAA